MTITNRVSKKSLDGCLYVPYSGVDENEDMEMTMFFEYEPIEVSGLKIVLRAHPSLLDAGGGGGGKRLGFTFSMSGRIADKGPTRGGVLLGTKGLGTDIEVSESAVADALMKQCNPILEIFDQQPDLLAEFFTGASEELHGIQRILLDRNTTDSQTTNGASKTL